MPELKKLECITVAPAEGGYVVMIESYSEEEGEELRMVIASSPMGVGAVVALELNRAKPT